MTENVQTQQIGETFRKMTEEQATRMNAAFEESRKLEQKWVEQATASVEEASRLWMGGVTYATQLSAEWRRLASEATRRGLDLFGTKG